jgi:AraC-like DNA-binding protein
MDPVVNPREASFWRRNVIMTGAGTRETPVVTFAGPLSIKGVLAGQIDWRTPEARFRLSPDTFVVLNNGQEYSLSTDVEGQCRTFCAFFEDKLVEETVRQLVTPDEALLDAPEGASQFGFLEHITSKTTATGRAFSSLAAAVSRGATSNELDWSFQFLARELAKSAVEDRRRPERLGSLRAATRNEIFRRVRLAQAALEDDLSRPWTLRAMADEACMGTHHFARSFSHCFGEPPRVFLARRRLERAKALLQSGHFTVTQACLEVGYASLASFSNSYRAHHGVSPAHHHPKRTQG